MDIMTLDEQMQAYANYKGLQQLEGLVETKIPDVRFYRKTGGHPRQSMNHESGIIVLGQGYKNLYANGTKIRYGGGNCLFMGVPRPVECEAFPINKDTPLFGLMINISKSTLQKMVNRFKEHHYSIPALSKDNISIQTEEMFPRMHNAFERLLSALCNDLEADILGPSIVEEILYLSLQTQGGSVLFELADKEGRYSRIASVLDTIHQNYSDSLNVADLASAAHMSVSAFHTAFRKVTDESPIQYIKKVRLNKAWELICFDGKKVNDTARIVGYTSTSQFSREFKRHFNESPKSARMTTTH